MSWVVYFLIVLAIIIFGVIFYFLFRRKLDKEERKLVRFLKKSGGEVDPRQVKDDMGVSRDWLESVSGRLEKKGVVVRWGWRRKSLICLKGSVVKRERGVVKLLKKNGGMMMASKVAKELGFSRRYFYDEVVEKLESKGILYRRREGFRNFLVLEGKNWHGLYGLHGLGEGTKKVELSKSEERIVKILRKSGGEMLDGGLKKRVRGADGIIKSLIKKGVVFRWGPKKRKVCLKDVLSEREKKVLRVLRDNGEDVAWKDLAGESGESVINFARILDRLEIRGRIIRKRVAGNYVAISLVR